MKTKTRSLLYVGGLLTALLVALAAYASKMVSPPTPDQLVGSWFGFDESRTYFCRLELTADGKGFFSSVYVDHPADLYTIEKWSLDGFALTLDPKAVHKEAEDIYVKGLADSIHLVLEMGGVGKKWNRPMTLFNEQTFLAKNKKAVERIEKFKEEKIDKSNPR